MSFFRSSAHQCLPSPATIASSWQPLVVCGQETHGRVPSLTGQPLVGLEQLDAGLTYFCHECAASKFGGRPG